jgi:hypothetical protein
MDHFATDSIVKILLSYWVRSSGMGQLPGMCTGPGGGSSYFDTQVLDQPATGVTVESSASPPVSGSP